jgi:hypothetical protein
MLREFEHFSTLNPVVNRYLIYQDDVYLHNNKIVGGLF